MRGNYFVWAFRKECEMKPFEYISNAEVWAGSPCEISCPLLLLLAVVLQVDTEVWTQSHSWE